MKQEKESTPEPPKEKELKTLKDINFKDLTTSRNRIKNRVKRELGIKWIKELEKYNTIDMNNPNYKIVPEYLKSFIDLGGEGIDANTCITVINWIKHIFNITDEDIKNA